jgi:hypothetical protein
MEARQIAVASHERAPYALGGGPGKKAIALAPDGLEKPRRQRLVAERIAHLADADPHDPAADGHARPHGMEQLVARDEPAGMLGQVAQERERLRAQGPFVVAVPQPPADPIEAEVTEGYETSPGHGRLVVGMASRPQGTRRLPRRASRA